MRLVLFHAAGIALFCLFAVTGAADLPIREEASAGVTFHSRFESPRSDLVLAIQALSAARDAGDEQERAEHLDRARRLVEASLAARPLNPFAWHDLALVRHMEGDAAVARRAFTRSLELGPYEETLAIARIALAIDLWPALDESERATVREQIVWIWPVGRRLVIELSRQSALAYALLRTSLADVPGAAAALDRP